MSSWCGQLLVGFLQAAVSSCLALLVAWQALVIGVIFGIGAFLLLCAGGVLCLLAVMVAHEFGHLLAGWGAGLSPQRLALGPVVFTREGDRLRARMNTAWFRPALYVYFEFVEGRVRPARWAAMVLGGPLSNLLIGAVCLAAASWHNPGPPTSVPHGMRAGWRSVALAYPGDPTTALLNMAGLSSLGLCLAVLVPGRVAGLTTDGGQLLALWRGKDAPNPALRPTAASTAAPRVEVTAGRGG